MAVKRNLFTNDFYIADMSSLKELLDRYPISLFPSIWSKITEAIEKGQLVSHIEVQREIRNTTNPEDKLLQWSNKNKAMFLSMDACQLSKIQSIKAAYPVEHWQNKLNRPGPWADPYLIAIAICEKAIIITQENKNKGDRIPVIASQFGIRSINLLEFFGELKIKL